MVDVEIKRGYEVLPDNNVRFGIRITNISDLAISDVEVTLDYPKSLFNLEGNRIQNLGNIPPERTHTAEFILKPLGCVHKVNIEALISYRDAKWNRQRTDMHPKEVHCVCPFLKGKAMPRAEFLEFSNAGHSAETGLNFKGVSVERLASYLVQTCKNRHHKVDDYSVDSGRMLYLASESIGEKAYYLLTALIKEDDGLTQVMLRAVSDKPHGLNGFLNETVAELRHLVNTVQSAQEIGIIKKEQVINIIDSIVQRTSFAGVGGEGGVSINIQDSVVQRTEFNAGDGEGTPIIEQSSIENWIKIGDVTFDIKYLKPRLDKNSDYENTSGNTAAFGGKKWTKGAPSTFVETPYGFIGISKTGVERGVAKELENAVQRNEITVSENIEPQLLEKEFEKREKIENLHKEELQNYGESRDSNKQERLINQKGKNGTNYFVLAIVFVILIFGLWSLGSGSNDVQDVSFSQPDVVPESIEPTSPQQSEVEPEVSQTPVPSFEQNIHTNSIGMEFVLIPAGEFDMGSLSSEEDRWDEEPVHHVKISNEFYLGKYEVTQKQWREIMGNNPSSFTGDDRPVETVSWNDVQEFIKKLNQKEGTDKYRLPSEAEWEYSARAGTTTRYSFGDSELRLDEYAWYYDNSGSETHPVGQKKPNPWGLYDMHGNVWEWVQDSWHDDYKGAPTDGSAWESGSGYSRVLRSGGLSHSALHCRSAYRNPGARDPRISGLGFRLLQEGHTNNENTDNITIKTDVSGSDQSGNYVTSKTDPQLYNNSRVFFQ